MNFFGVFKYQYNFLLCLCAGYKNIFYKSVKSLLYNDMRFKSIASDKIKAIYESNFNAKDEAKNKCTYTEDEQSLTINETAGQRLPSTRTIIILCVYAMIFTICVCTCIFFLIQLYNTPTGSFSQAYYQENLDLFSNKEYQRLSLYSHLTIGFRHNGLPRRQENLILERHDTRKVENSDKILSCYYNLPSDFSNISYLQPSMIHPHLCTHINIAFVEIVNKTLYITETFARGVRLVGKLKESNPDLKILLSVGGSGANNGFSDMVVNHASRKTFIRSVMSILREYDLDGIDLDWEFPAVHNIEPFIIKSRERQHFSQLLREIRVEFKRHQHIYLLSVAVAAPKIIVDTAYDVDQLELFVDYVNLMTYDYHYYSLYTPFTGLNSPLFARQNEHYYLSTLNVNFTVNMYIAKGLNRDKILVGIPTYGHTFYLVNANDGGLNSPASGYGSLGSSGFVNYPTICQFIHAHRKRVIVDNETDAKVPYMHKDHEWVSYDDQYSVMEKARYVKDNDIRGVMVYSLNCDDYHGMCPSKDQIKFPLINSIRNELCEFNNF